MLIKESVRMDVKGAIEKEYRTYEAEGLPMPYSSPEQHELHVGFATQRALRRIALGTLSDELYEYVRSFVLDVNLGDIRNDTYEGNVYHQEFVAALSPEQLAQLITYLAQNPIKLANKELSYIGIFDEEARGFRIETLPTASDIEPDPDNSPTILKELRSRQ